MDCESALKLLAKNGLAHTPASLARLLADGRVSGTGSLQQQNLTVDEASLKAYVAKYREFKENPGLALFRGPLG